MSSSYLSTAGQDTVRQWFGIYAGVVVNNNDITGANRVTAMVPQVMGNAVTTWIEPLIPSDSAAPTPGSQIIVQFLGGDPDHPMYLPYSYSAAANVVDSPTTFTSSVTFDDPVVFQGATYFSTSNGLVPAQPGVTPLVAETWHAISLDTANFTSGGTIPATMYGRTGGPQGTTYANYRLTTDQEVHLSALVTIATTGGGGNWYTLTNTNLPTGYLPVTNKYFPVQPDDPAVPVSPGNSGPLGVLMTTGGIRVSGFSTNAVVLSFDVRLPLTF
jgi:hypothetical protein